MGSFNSIKVRLEPYQTVGSSAFRDGFNSIKVRLEHDKCIPSFNVQTFQFHKGTIRTYSCPAYAASSVVSIP